MKRSIILLSMLALVTNLYAGGFDNSSVGIKSTLLGSALTGAVHGSSAIFYNPASLAMMTPSKWDVEIYSHFAFTDYTATSPSGEFKSDLMATIPGLFLSHTTDRLGFGLGIYIPFGGGALKYDDVPMQGSTTESSAGIIAITPTLSIKLMDQLAVGIGPSLYYGVMGSKTDVYLGPAIGIMNVENTFNGIAGFGGSVGFLFQASELIDMGLSLKLPISVKINGTQTTTLSPSPANEADATVEFTLPMYVNYGLSFKFSPEMKILFDISYRLWSSMDKMVITAEGSAPVEAETYNKDTINVAVGWDYQIAPPLNLLAGIRYDQAAAGDKGLSITNIDVDTLSLTLGLGYALNEALEVILGGGYLIGTERKVGQLTYNKNMAALSVGVEMGF